jgi:ADP-heptose:LPS heptosyltransferase
VAHLRALAERLATECGARVLLLWGPDEIHMARQIRDGVSMKPILAPPTDLHELAALLRRASLLVANDTGPLHLAAALGTPCLGLFGPTRAARNGPYGARCRGLQSPDGTMAGLAPGTVFEAARSMLAREDGAA